MGSPRDIRFITFSCQHRLPLLKNPAICDLFADSLAAVRLQHRFHLYAWVVMPEHAHLLLRPHDNAPLADALRSMKTSIAKKVIHRWRRLDAPILQKLRTPNGVTHFWLPGGGFDRNVRDEHEFRREVRYIHRNPVERGLVERPKDRKWSSVRWWMGEQEAELECDSPPGDPRSWAMWKGYV